MPNYCNNNLKLHHADPAMIERAAKAFQEHRLLEEFVPVPPELKETMAGSYGDGYKRELHEFTQQLNRKYFGHANWYDFCVSEWGTKWDVGGDDSYLSRDTPNEISMGFESAWSPPIYAYEKLQALGFQVTAYYWEPGMGFCGRFDSDGDYYLEGIGDAKDAAKRIPKDIDDEMHIVADLESWEDMENE